MCFYSIHYNFEKKAWLLTDELLHLKLVIFKKLAIIFNGDKQDNITLKKQKRQQKQNNNRNP